MHGYVSAAVVRASPDLPSQLKSVTCFIPRQDLELKRLPFSVHVPCLACAMGVAGMWYAPTGNSIMS